MVQEINSAGLRKEKNKKTNNYTNTKWGVTSQALVLPKQDMAIIVDYKV